MFFKEVFFINTPSKQQRLAAIDLVEKNSRSTGQFLKKDVQDFKVYISKIQKMFPAYSSNLNSCLNSTKNILTEVVAVVHKDMVIKNNLQLKWFKSFLKTILNCIRAGLNFALGFINNFVKNSVKNLGDTILGASVAAVSLTMLTTSVVIGVVAAMIILGLGLWMNSAEKKSVVLRTEPKIMDKIKIKIDDYMNTDDEIPEELLPPEPKTPNVTLTTYKEGASLVGGLLFVLFLKAAITHRFNEEMKEKATIFSSLITPTGAIMGLVSMFLLAGSGGLSALAVI